MAQEIERKYLVEDNPWEWYKDVKTTKIIQGYFTNSPIHTIRVRMKTDLIHTRDVSGRLPEGAWFAGKQTSCITIKGPRVDITCDEFEYPIPNEEAAQLIKMCDLGVVEKIRHTFLDENGQRWEIDEFTDHNKGIPHLAEIELKTADTMVIPLYGIILDVSNDPHFVNSYLAQHRLHFHPTDHSLIASAFQHPLGNTI